MNIFYAPPTQIQGEVIELSGQEAVHASKALRYQQGDKITVVDGEGGWYEGRIQLTTDDTVRVRVQNAHKPKTRQPAVILGIGIIKKRDRLEFAVEKAVELGVKEIALFRGEHTIKQNIRLDRLQSIALSAMKQSLRAWLPEVSVFRSLVEVVEAHPDCQLIAAHETEEKLFRESDENVEKETLLLVGPEGGFSGNEIDFLIDKQADLVSLGSNRLRTETAALTLLNQYRYCFLNR